MKLKAAVRQPFFMKLWEDYPRTWKFIIDLGILVKYKTLNISKIPNKIVLPCSNFLFVNSAENRGRALLISNGVTQKRLTHFWTKAVAQLNPDLVIDVGVNYGECIFFTTYPIHTKIYGIEANSQLLPYINQSKEAHPNQSQMTIIHALASDKDDEETIFFVDKHWSGTSSASYMPSHNKIEKVPVKSIKIDTLFEGGNYKTVLFKVDVEGYEAFVLKGMTNLFTNSSSLLGIIEFNSEYLEKLGFQVDEFLKLLHTYFTVYVYTKDDILIKAKNFKLVDFQSIFDSHYIHTDFVLVKNEGMIEKLDLSIE